ncbi:Bug family tripartite tricarboxylate transporter substrate binding protein [Streptomyces sp. NBC_01361]|uniref:Bug family tripartite tricarboxylate transporter substrate binding protein n=1 Tax=Streptomyces sp. NBC_01361 TaxID=2903838 RepID=UPI002E338164|nr:tripartite tricarboxylate transporter substrate binding protein [Streptomyces sp. NBC_01361]
MRGPARAFLGTVAALTLLTVSACGVFPGGQAQSDRDLRIMVPNTPGGGYDTTARTAARVMDETHIAPDVQVFNLPGAGGTVGLQRIVDERGNGELALQMGLGVVGASHEAKAKVTVARTTPIARLIEEAGAVVVRKNSPYRTVGDLITAWRKAPERLAVGGGSSPGGPDYLLPMELAKAVGIDPKKVDYVGYGGGGGDLLPALLDGEVDFATSGLGEFLDQVDSGQLRVLAVTGEHPVEPLAGVPTLKSSGIDLVFSNWRGIVAPPGISDADRKRWVDALTDLHRSARWQAELDRHGWTDAFATGDTFAAYLTQQDKLVADLAASLGRE